MGKINELINLLGSEDFIYIQTHNFPSHDSIASAFGLQHLLKTKHIKSYLIYKGEIQSDSLSDLIQHLDIHIRLADKEPLRPTDKIIIVDGCKGNKNVTDLIGDEIAIIDHHKSVSPEEVSFSDIRSNYGACSSIIYSYYAESKTEIPSCIATALLVGLLWDTGLMTKNVCEADIDAYTTLYASANIQLVNSILRNNIQQKDLSFYKKAIENVRIRDGFAFCYFEDGCNQSLLGVIGDFFLSLTEVDFVILCAKNNGKINFSLRSEVDKWNASQIIDEILKGLGFGGGHHDLAGGIINDASLFDEESFFSKTARILKG